MAHAHSSEEREKDVKFFHDIEVKRLQRKKYPWETALKLSFNAVPYFETIAEYDTRYVIIDIQAWSFTRVNSLRLQSQCLAITAFCKAPQKDKFYLSF